MKRVWILDHLGVALVVGAALGFAAVGGAAAWVAYSVESRWESVGYAPVTCASLAEVEHYAPASTIDVAGAGMYEYFSGLAWVLGVLVVNYDTGCLIDVVHQVARD